MINCCNICNSKNSEKLYSGILKCKNCSHVYADISIDQEELKALYKKNYFFGEEYLNYTSDKEIIQKNFKLRLNKIYKYKKNKTQSLLEIGSAYGYFLDLIKNDFQKIAGVEISEDCLDFCKKNYDFSIYNFLEFEIKLKEKYDFFCLWDVIEHLKDPNKYIDRISELSNKDSIIAITTGNIESLNSKIFGENWRLIHPPTHLHYFSYNSIKTLLEKNNFKIIHFEHCGYYRSLKFIFYKLKIQKNLKFLLQYLFNGNLSLYLNLYDIMFIIAKKID